MALIIYTSDLCDFNNIAWDQNTKVDPQNEHDLNFFPYKKFFSLKSYFRLACWKTSYAGNTVHGLSDRVSHVSFAADAL